jgi:glycerol kinase
MATVLSIDAGTTGVRALAVDHRGEVLDVAYRELTQYFPQPGWVEHDAAEIWEHVSSTLAEVSARLAARGERPVAIGLTNQRETVVAFDRSTGRPLHRAIVWQDRRTAPECAALRDAGHLPRVRAATGLVLDPYFSATKMAWLLRGGALDDHRPADLALGTVDSWVLWNLTGGTDGGGFLTDPTNASRTLVYDIGERAWSDELCELFRVPRAALAEVRPSCGRFGLVAPGAGAGLEDLAGVPISGVAGDQQSALFGQACFSPGMVKATYGTGSFVLYNVGERCPEVAEGLVTTIAWDLGEHAGNAPRVSYALEGSTFASGAAIQWLRDGLGVIEQAADVGPLAASVPDSGGVSVVPAFTGLGSPWWDPDARGTITGLTRGSGVAQLARAVVESLSFSVRAMVDAMVAATGQLAELRVDGGAAAMNLLLELQADQVRVPVARPRSTESTALGAAMLAGLAEGVWAGLDELAALWQLDVEHRPQTDQLVTDAAYAQWLRTVDRSRALD